METTIKREYLRRDFDTFSHRILDYHGIIFLLGGNNLKNEKEVTQISAKLNPEFDMELIEHISKIPKRERSYTYREALNKYFKEKEEEK